MAKARLRRTYLIPVLSKALDILELMSRESQPVSLEAIHRKTKVSKTTVYRILKTFVHRGYLAQSNDGLYRAVPRPNKVRFGFAGQSKELPFSEAVTRSLESAAVAAGVDLIVLDNCYDAATALNNAEELVRLRVDVVIEFQVEQQVAPIIADKIAGAEIPFIAVDIPHPHATYFGVDNYRVGYEAGSLLGGYAVSSWSGKVDWVIGLDLEEAGATVQSRITGAFEAIRSRVPGGIPAGCFVRLDGRGLRENSYRLIAGFLKAHPRATHILIAAATDTSALGAIEAVREAKREHHVAVVGQDCLAEMQDEMRRAGSPAIGSVSHEVAQYGPELIQIGLSLLRGEVVAPYNYVDHVVVTPATLPALR